MKKAVGGRKADTVLVLILFSVFAISVLFVIMLSASIYRNMTEITRDSQEERTVLSYIWSKVKNHDEAGNVYVGEFGGLTALCFDKEYGGTMFQTAIYHHDGWVCELFYEKGVRLYPEDGIQIVKIDELTFEEIDYGLIRASAGARSLLISPRGETIKKGGLYG